MGKIIRNGIEYPTSGGGGGSSWIESVPEMHRNIFRGQSLGSSVTAAQLEEIQNGTFSGLYVGDYWEISNVTYRIADIDFFCQNSASPFPFTTHHLVIVPDLVLYSARMNDSATSSTGYYNSKMRTTNLATAKTTINTAFPNLVLTYKDYLVNATSSGVASGGDFYDCDVELMSETMIFGCPVNRARSNSTPQYPYASLNPTQFALFRLCPNYINVDRSEDIWLRDAANSSQFCTMEVVPLVRNANTELGVRPYFLIGEEEEEETEE